MYGMVNDGIRRFVVETHGEPAWDEIRAAAGVDDRAFDTMSVVPDSVTYDLVAAICEKFDITAQDALNAFGAYWPEFASRTAWGRLLDFNGNGFRGCLESLDEMHDRISATMPHLQPPSFEVEPLSDTSFHVYYMSHRQGLTPMVAGLLHGLAKRFGEEIRVTHLPEHASEDGEVFTVEIITKRVETDVAA
ncbi:MAG: heme NO-binding domain-containing protein [Pseudomonadota bacterium]